MQRPDWTRPSNNRSSIDLSLNVHFDGILNDTIKSLMGSIQTFHDYPNQYMLYDAIAGYYNLSIDKLTIGYGATDVIERIFKSIPFDTVYVVEPSFQMVEVYCSIYNKRFIPLTIDEALCLANVDDNSILCVANPNGNDGSAYDISGITDKFKYVISDEVYADFYDRFSLLHTNIDNVIIVKSFSKSLGIAGFRCGFAVASPQITEELQRIRSNFIMTSFSSLIIPDIISMTPDVVSRMQYTKDYLQSSYKCKPSYGNYVLFEAPNRYTQQFGSKYINGYYRMALTDIATLETL